MTTTEIKKAAKDSADNQVANRGTLGTVKGALRNLDIIERFKNMLGDNAASFMSSIVSLVSSSDKFNNVDPNTIMQAAFQAANMNLPVNQNLGFAYIIPYGNTAQFQMGYKGFIQLALRTGQYKTINATEIYEGELITNNRITGEIVIDPEEKSSEKIVGYSSYFKLINGFEKHLYMTVEELEAHGKKYSKSYDKSNGLWKKDPHKMMLKTLLKLLLSKYGILSVDMQRAMESDQAAITEDEEGQIKYDYVDNPETEEVEEVKNGATKEDLLARINTITDVKNISGFKKEFEGLIKTLSEEDQKEISNACIEQEEIILEFEKKTSG